MGDLRPNKIAHVLSFLTIISWIISAVEPFPDIDKTYRDGGSFASARWG